MPHLPLGKPAEPRKYKNSLNALTEFAETGFSCARIEPQQNQKTLFRPFYLSLSLYIYIHEYSIERVPSIVINAEDIYFLQSNYAFNVFMSNERSCCCYVLSHLCGIRRVFLLICCFFFGKRGFV